MHKTILYRLLVLSIFGLMPFANLQAAPALAPEHTVVEMSEAKQIFEQAKAYHDGEGVPQDLPKAYTLYATAAELGNVDAKVNLGYMLFVGEGCEQNYYDARTWYSQAAGAGDADAIATLAMMDRHKLGITIANTAEISASTSRAKPASLELDEMPTLGTEDNTDVSDYTPTQTELPDALDQGANTTVITAQTTDPIKSEATVFDTELNQAVAPKRSAFSLPTYVLYLLAGLGAAIMAMWFHLRRRKHLRQQNLKIILTPC